MTVAIEHHPRAAVLANPGDKHALEALIRSLDAPRETIRWVDRLLRLTDFDIFQIEGFVLRRAIDAFGSLPPDEADSRYEAIRYGLRGGPFLATLLLAAFVAHRPKAFRDARDGTHQWRPDAPNSQKRAAILSPDVEVPTAVDAYDISLLKGFLAKVLERAGYIDESRIIHADNRAVNQALRERFNENGARHLIRRWTVPIGHLVITAFLAKGVDAGLLDFDDLRLWDARVANDALRRRILETTPAVSVVPNATMFAEDFAAHGVERLDGRDVDQFEACGIIADRAGDAEGAIFRRPGPDDPAFHRFFQAFGLSPSDRIVTLHGREARFRADGNQNLRNVDIDSYRPALAALVARGYRIVRMGDPSMTPLDDMEGVADYARSKLKTEELDILLPGIARFHIGCASGLSHVPLLYATPTLSLNWMPADLLPWGRRNWTVLKPLRALDDGVRVTDWTRYLPLGRLISPYHLHELGYAPADLEPDEIRDVVLDFAATVERPTGAPERSGRNIGRVLLAGDGGRLVDVDLRTAGP